MVRPVAATLLWIVCWVGVCWAHVAAAEQAGVLVQAEGQVLRAACAGNEARVEGNHNTVVLVGPCRGLAVNGVANTVTVDLRAGAVVRVEGSANRVTYRSAGGAPSVVALGPDNVVREDGAVAAVALPSVERSLAGKPQVSALAGTLALVGDDQQRLADCAGRDVSISGARSAYVLRGGCRSITVVGDLDTVQAEVAGGARIAIEGAGTVVAWATLGAIPGAPAGAPVERVRGRESRVRRTDMIGGVAVR